MIPLPGYIDSEAWAGFVEMRKASGRTRPFTVRAATLILFELQRLKDAGREEEALARRLNGMPQDGHRELLCVALHRLLALDHELQRSELRR